jgi:hypothetical protein
MNTFQVQNKTIKSDIRQLSHHVSSQAQQTIDIGSQRGWHFHLLGQAPLPTIPIRLENWLILPATQDQSNLPPKTFQKIQTLYANGVRPKGFVVVHEAPRSLPAPKIKDNPKPVTTKLPTTGELKTDPSSLVTIFTSLSSLLGPMMMIMGAVFMGLAMIDPILVVVTEAGEWIEIDRWDVRV